MGTKIGKVGSQIMIARDEMMQLNAASVMQNRVLLANLFGIDPVKHTPAEQLAWVLGRVLFDVDGVHRPAAGSDPGYTVSSRFFDGAEKDDACNVARRAVLYGTPADNKGAEPTVGPSKPSGDAEILVHRLRSDTLDRSLKSGDAEVYLEAVQKTLIALGYDVNWVYVVGATLVKDCGKVIPNVCPYCGHDITNETETCSVCGRDIDDRRL